MNVDQVLISRTFTFLDEVVVTDESSLIVDFDVVVCDMIEIKDHVILLNGFEAFEDGVKVGEVDLVGFVDLKIDGEILLFAVSSDSNHYITNMLLLKHFKVIIIFN